ncbi:MAG: PHP domain-containing protein [Chloroflexota bacterium]
MTGTERTLRVEFHCHTIFSRDSLVTPEELLAACRKRGVDRVVVTDHNTIQGALAAQAIDPERVIVGEEILTQQGELLAAYVQEEIPEGLPPVEAIARLREQGALISVSHPYDVTRKGHWKPAELEQIAPLVDAIEVFNARCLLAKYNRQAAAFAAEHNLLGTVGSDAHTRAEYGRAVLLLPEFSDGTSLKDALRDGKQQVRSSGLRVRFGSRYALIKKSIAGEI